MDGASYGLVYDPHFEISNKMRNLYFVVFVQHYKAQNRAIQA